MNSADEARYADLLAWGKQHGATLHKSVEVYNDPLTKHSLRLNPSAQPPDQPFTVVTCPASVTLSYLNALIGGPLPPDLALALAPSPPLSPSPSPTFPAPFMSSLPPHVIGRFFLVQQYLLGPRSFWHAYIRTLPPPDRPSAWALPAFWPEADLDFLEGTNAEVAAREVQAAARAEFKQARRILKEAEEEEDGGGGGAGGGGPRWRDYSRLLYHWAFCVFASRSFRPSTVLSERLRRELRLRAVLPAGCGDDDFSVLMPVLDIGNHDPRARVEWDAESEPGAVRFVTRDRYAPGEQVCNNYGAKTNSELLLGYGFVIPEAAEVHNDYVHARKRRVEGDADGEAGETKPKDFLISLRPMSDPASVAGRARQRVRVEEGFGVVSGLAHVEDSLVWDLVVAQASQDAQVRGTVEKLLQESPGGGDINHCLRRILASPTPPELEELVDKLRMALLAKLSYDYERIIDPEVYEDGEPALVPANQNQELAMAYRRQCKKVLETVITALGGQVEGAGEEGP